MSITTSENPGHRGEAAPAVPSAPLSQKLRDPGYQAFVILRAAFFAAPILFGVDKFFNWMTYWPKYQWAGPPHWLGVSPQHFMSPFVGVSRRFQTGRIPHPPSPRRHTEVVRRRGPSFPAPARFLSLHHHPSTATPETNGHAFGELVAVSTNVAVHTEPERTSRSTGQLRVVGGDQRLDLVVAEQAARDLLIALGPNPDSEHLADTPRCWSAAPSANASSAA